MCTDRYSKHLTKDFLFQSSGNMAILKKTFIDIASAKVQIECENLGTISLTLINRGIIKTN